MLKSSTASAPVTAPSTVFEVLDKPMDIKPLLDVLESGGPEYLAQVIDTLLFDTIQYFPHQLDDQAKSRIFILKRLRDAILWGADATIMDQYDAIGKKTEAEFSC